MADHLPIHHLILGGRQRGDGFGQHVEGLHPQRDLAGAGAEHLPAGLDEIAQVELAVEQVQRLLAQVVGAQEELDAPIPVFDVGKGDLAHRADGAQPPGQGDRDRLAVRAGSLGGFERRMASWLVWVRSARVG